MPPPRHILNQLRDLGSESNESRSYTEYRIGLIKLFGKKFNNGEKADDFVNKILNSQDLKSLLFDTALCKSIDTMGGIPKIALTILSKYAETYY